MLPFGDSRLTRIAFAVFFVLVLGYAYFEARGLIFGPTITVSSEIQEVREMYVRITGKAERIAKLAMNGKDIPVTQDGAFDQPYLLAPGLNRILFDATDKYGRTAQRVVVIIYTPKDGDVPSPPTSATSTPAATTSPRATTTIDIETSATSTLEQ